jgi:hypothetical protein
VVFKLKEYFDIPTETQLKKRVRNIIENSSNSELEGLFNKAIYNIKYCPTPSLVPQFKEEKKWILEEIKKRNMRAPTFFNKLLNRINSG